MTCTEIGQMVCGCCRQLVAYPRGAVHVQCFGCSTINLVLEGACYFYFKSYLTLFCWYLIPNCCSLEIIIILSLYYIFFLMRWHVALLHCLRKSFIINHLTSYPFNLKSRSIWTHVWELRCMPDAKLLINHCQN